MNMWAKIPGPGRAPFSVLQLCFLCLVSPVLLAQASTSDIQQAAAAECPGNSLWRMTIFAPVT